MEEELLLQRILDKVEDPTNLSLALLQKITGNFSEERKLGQGGFGEVYKGVLGEKVVAVKRIHINENTVDDKIFRRELDSLRKTNHRNVVRFLGFCSNTYQKTIEVAGSKDVNLVNIKERLLCFEYIGNGSLDKHITDELRGLEWETRYEIILGICNGLRYLHKETGIIHMDLKPANILLDHQDEKYMVPKITDFGLSRPNINSNTVGQCYGTRGYLAPEYEEGSKTTPACDIYSLGAVLRELVTGSMDVPNQDNVFRRWRHRWNKPPTHLQYQQVIKCIEIAGLCRKREPENRPSIEKIIDFLNESTDRQTGQECTYLDDDMLGIEPLELHFTFKLNKEMSWSVKLTNKTKARFSFNIERPSKQYTIQPEKGFVPPECDAYFVQITLKPQERAPQVIPNADKFVVRSMKVSEGLRDFTEHIFHEEASKVVDEVNLMVVYDPTNPHENCKHRKDTNTPTEEVIDKVEERKIVESSSRKGKNKLASSENAASMDVNSSAQRQYILHPLQSFSRRYPANTKYLGKKSPVVDHTTGAMGSLLDKLGKLVTKDYNLERTVKTDIEYFSVQLKKIHLELAMLENVDGVEVLVDEVRELSYHIEDMVDSFLVHVEPDSIRSGFRELVEEGLKLWEKGMITHHQIGDVIRDIKNQVQDVVNMKEHYNFNVNNVVSNVTVKATIDPRMAMYRNKEQLIGIDAPRDELIRLFEEDGYEAKSDLRIVSIVGLGGLGKTTLAKVVYEELNGYNLKAFVTVGQNPDLATVLKKIIRECQGREYNVEKLNYLDDWELIKELKFFLKDKRYFIVVDDLWDWMLWDTINSAFPRDHRGSRVITTTRIQNVVDREPWNLENKVYRMKPLSDEDSRILFFVRITGHLTPRKEEISKDILKRCGGMPLAINSIASHLARDKRDTFWEHVRKSLGAIKGNDIEKMKEILDLSYLHLPDYLKTCLLYVCMYPEDCEINKNDLLRKWVAEGFVSRTGGADAMDVAEEYFQTLISMCMIEPARIDYNDEVLSCRIHDIILDLLRSKSSEENFIQVIDCLKEETESCGQTRRVSVHYNDEDDSNILATIKGSLEHVRSVFYHGSLVPYLMEFKYVRVLHLKQKVYGNYLDLTGISMLFLLRYLKVETGCSQFNLPDQIGQLQQLETIDLRGGELKNYPSDIVTLPWLSDLRYESRSRGVALPDKIERLQSLHTLIGVCVYKSSVDNINGLGKLTNLRRLELRWRDNNWINSKQVISMRMGVLHSSICELASLRILNFGEDSFMEVQGWSKSLLPRACNILELNLFSCTFQRCPEWIGQLHGLYSFRISVKEVADGVSIVSGLPSLAHFQLDGSSSVLNEESVVISGGGAFPALKQLDFECPKASLIFEAGALPKLEKLSIMFRLGMSRRFLPLGIQNLPASSLKDIFLFRDFNSDGDSLDWGEDDHVEHSRRFRIMLKKAFKPHHPAACIRIDLQVADDIEDDDIQDDEDYVTALHLAKEKRPTDS